MREPSLHNPLSHREVLKFDAFTTVRGDLTPGISMAQALITDTESTKDVVRRFAQAGFCAIAPEIYHREGGKQGKNFQEMRQISSKVTRAQYLGDIRAAADYQESTTPVRVLLVTGMLFPLGLSMGMAFPLGTRLASGRAPALTPWLWGINGATAVCASVLAIVIPLSAKAAAASRRGPARRSASGAVWTGR